MWVFYMCILKIEIIYSSLETLLESVPADVTLQGTVTRDVLCIKIL